MLLYFTFLQLTKTKKSTHAPFKSVKIDKKKLRFKVIKGATTFRLSTLGISTQSITAFSIKIVSTMALNIRTFSKRAVYKNTLRNDTQYKNTA